MCTMCKRVIVMMVMVAAVSCGGKKNGSPGRDQGGQMGPVRPSPPRLTAEVTSLQKRLVLSASEKDRYGAVDQLVKGWPRTQGALGAALGLVRADTENQGGLAMSLAGLGRPLVPALNKMVAGSPRHLPTLRAGGVLSYHLVVLSGLTQRTDVELAALRKALRPTFEHMWAMFLTEDRPDLEIYLGVAVGASEAIRRFLARLAQGKESQKLTRVAMALNLILSNKPNEIVVPAPERARLRNQSAPLAKRFAEALPKARPDGAGESPASLLLGLSVLGAPAARALAAVFHSAKPAECRLAVKSAQGLLDQFPASELAPLRPLLKRCAGLKWSGNPEVSKALSKLLAKMSATGRKPAPKSAPTP